MGGRKGHVQHVEVGSVIRGPTVGRDLFYCRKQNSVNALVILVSSLPLEIKFTNLH